jgi:hypothetical protein
VGFAYGMQITLTWGDILVNFAITIVGAFILFLLGKHVIPPLLDLWARQSA